MKQNVSEIELARVMSDQAARSDSMGRLARRNFTLQQLLTRVQSLSDEDFESVVATFSSMVVALETRRKKIEEERDKGKAKPKDLLKEVQSKVTQSQGKLV